MQTVINAYSYASSLLLDSRPAVEHLAEQPPSNDVKGESSKHLENLPCDIFKSGTLYLSTKNIITLASTSKNLFALMQSSFPPLFLALSDIRAVHTNWMPVLQLSNAIESIQALSCRTDRTSLLRTLIVGIPSYKLFLDKFLPENQRTATPNFQRSLHLNAVQMSDVPDTVRDALSLLDLFVARCTTSQGADRRTIMEYVLKTSNQEFWPAMLASVCTNADVAYYCFDINRKFCDFIGKVPDCIAEIMALSLYSNNCWTTNAEFEMIRADKYQTGPIIRKKMEEKFGVMQQEKWDAIDARMASYLSSSTIHRPGVLFDEACRCWRQGDAFVIQTEEAVLAVNPNYDFGDRAMVSPTPRATLAISTIAFDLMNGR